MGDAGPHGAGPDHVAGIVVGGEPFLPGRLCRGVAAGRGPADFQRLPLSVHAELPCARINRTSSPREWAKASITAISRRVTRIHPG